MQTDADRGGKASLQGDKGKVYPLGDNVLYEFSGSKHFAFVLTCYPPAVGQCVPNLGTIKNIGHWGTKGKNLKRAVK